MVCPPFLRMGMTDRSKWTPERRAAENAKQKENYHGNIEARRSRAREKYYGNRAILIEKKKAWVKANPEKAKESRRKWLIKNPTYEAQWKARERKRRPARTMFYHARLRAKRYGLPFDLVEADIIVPIHCPVLGVILAVGGGRRKPNSPTLDRVFPDRGYIKGNVCVISWRANRLKDNATLHELEALATYVRGYS